MTTLTRKYKTRLEAAIRREEMQEGYEQMKEQFGADLAELDPSTLDRLAALHRSFGIAKADGMAKFMQELANRKRGAVA